MRHLFLLLLGLPLFAGCVHVADQPAVSAASPLDAGAPVAMVSPASPLTTDATTRAYNARMAQVEAPDSAAVPAGAGMADMSGMSGMNSPNSASPSAAKDATLLYYTCPMHPEIHSATPGKCPLCGMTLVPHYGEEHP